MTLGKREPHLFSKVPGIWSEVGGQHKLSLDDFIHGLLPVLCSEGWLEETEGEDSLWASHQALARPRKGISPSPALLPRRLDLPIQ
jgi:hypothetical protein